MRGQIRAPIAPWLRAAIRGVRSVYPAARICLHVTALYFGPDDRAAGDFFDSIQAPDMPFDIIGLRHPLGGVRSETAATFFRVPRFNNTLQRLASPRRPIQIVETGHDAKVKGTQATPSPRSSFRPEGQADSLRDFTRAIRGRVKPMIRQPCRSNGNPAQRSPNGADGTRLGASTGLAALSARSCASRSAWGKSASCRTAA